MLVSFGATKAALNTIHSAETCLYCFVVQGHFYGLCRDKISLSGVSEDVCLSAWLNEGFFFSDLIQKQGRTQMLFPRESVPVGVDKLGGSPQQTRTIMPSSCG